MELLVKPEMLTSYKYGPTFGNAETVSFYLLHNVSNTESMQRGFLPASWQSVYTQLLQILPPK